MAWLKRILDSWGLRCSDCKQTALTWVCRDCNNPLCAECRQGPGHGWCSECRAQR